MHSSHSIEALYKILSKVVGPAKAKQGVSDIIYIVLDDLQETGSPITAEAIDKKLAEKADDYIQAAKDQVA